MEYTEAENSDPAHSTRDLTELDRNIEHQSAHVEYIEPSESTNQPNQEKYVSNNTEDKTYGFDTGGIAAFLVEAGGGENQIVVDALDVVPEYQVIEKSKKKKRLYLFGGISLLVIILILLIGVITRTVARRGDNATEIRNPPYPTNPPSQVETKILPSAKLNSTIRSQYNEIADFDSAFSDENSSQYRAASWVEDFGVTNMSDVRIINRFSLATFYFATNGDQWTKCGRQSTHCSITEEWLTAENECDWYGIKCSDDSQITAIHFPPNRERQHKIIGTLPYELSFLSKLAMFIVPSHANRPPNVQTPGFGDGISGPFPDWSRLSTLTHLYLNDHQLEGTFPTYLLQKNLALKEIELKNSSFQGNLFEDLSSVNSTALTKFIVKGNNFTGPISAQINRLSSLNTLDISRNGFSGTLPDELSTLTNLVILNVSNNAFTGTIFAGFGNLTNLRTLELYSNDLSGSVPKELCDIREEESGKFSTLSVDCMEVSCTCCTNCPLGT